LREIRFKKETPMEFLNFEFLITPCEKKEIYEWIRRVRIKQNIDWYQGKNYHITHLSPYLLFGN